MQNNIIQVTEEMLQQAAQEIGFTYDEGCLDYVTHMLQGHYGIELSKDAPITWQVMVAVTDVVHEWQNATKSNM